MITQPEGYKEAKIFASLMPSFHYRGLEKKKAQSGIKQIPATIVILLEIDKS